MGKVRVRAENGKLFLDFKFAGLRCREQTALIDTPQNRSKVQQLLKKVEAKILLNQLVYEEIFPTSKNIEKVKNAQRRSQLLNSVANESQLNFSDFAEQWYFQMEISWRQSHKINIRRMLDKVLIPYFGKMCISEITKRDVLNFRAELAKRCGKNKQSKLNPKTVNSYINCLRMIFESAVDQYEFDSPVRNIKALKVPKINIQPFSIEEVKLFLSSVRSDFTNYYTVRFFTGLRTGEIDGLRWEYIDFDRREILIRETIVAGRKEYTKTDGSQREIPMLDVVYEALQKQEKVTHGKSEYVFCNNVGKPLDHTNVTKRVWYPLLRYLGMKRRRPYQTRHTAATLLLAAGENPEWVAKVLGHSSTEMLFKVYSRYIPNLTRQDGSAVTNLLVSAGLAGKQIAENEQYLSTDQSQPEMRIL